jgi:site-specific recombinase XerD
MVDHGNNHEQEEIIMSKHHENLLVRQTLDKVGKNWGLATLTVAKHIANLKTIGRFMSKSQGLNDISNMKTKHVDAFVKFLREDKQLAPSTLQGYATALRLVASAIGKDHIVKSNFELGATRPNIDRFKNSATPSDIERLAGIKSALYSKNEWQGTAFELQEKFGLRIKESLGANKVEQIDGREYLRIPAGFTKNSLERLVEIISPEQREILAKVSAIKDAQGTPGIIPAKLSLRQGYWKQVNAIRNLGGTKMNHANSHCLRREHIRERYSAIKNLPDKTERENAKQQLIEESGHFDTDKLKHYTE